MLRGLILGVHVILAGLIIGLVLLQRGKGAEAGAGFGAGASGTVFGARGASTLFSKLTAVFATLFFITSLSLAYMSTKTPSAPTSVLERAAETQSTVTPLAPALPTAPASAVIKSAPPAVTAPASAVTSAPAPTKKP